MANVLHSFAPSYILNGKPDSVTALSVRPTPIENNVALVAVGLESGRMELWKVPIQDKALKPQLIRAIPDSLCHRATVTKLAWKPHREEDGEECSILASSSLDRGVRVFHIR